MALQMLLGLRDFLPPERLVELARPDGSDANGDPLLIFQTSKQQTWLISFPSGLACVLDDIRFPEPRISWRLDRSMLVNGSDVVIPVTTEEYKPATGKINFGQLRSGWLYSKGLFEGVKVEDKVRELIKQQMLTPSQTSAAHP